MKNSFIDEKIDVSKEVNLVLSIANMLRGPYKADDYKKVIIPMTIIRRLECALEKTKNDLSLSLLNTQKELENMKSINLTLKLELNKINKEKEEFQQNITNLNNQIKRKIHHIQKWTKNFQ